MLVTVANQKGGVGKTAIATMLTAYLLREERAVVGCDLDELRAFTRRCRDMGVAVREDFQAFALAAERFCICDTPPGILSGGKRIMEAITRADLLVVPTGAASDSVFAALRVGKCNPNAVAVVRGLTEPQTMEAVGYLREQAVFTKVLSIKTYPRISKNFDENAAQWLRGMQVRQKQELLSVLSQILDHPEGRGFNGGKV